jgi:hypothetical protein
MKDGATPTVDQKGQAHMDAPTMSLELAKSVESESQPDSTDSPRGECLQIEDAGFPSQTTTGGIVKQIWSQLTLAEISGSSQMNGELRRSKYTTARRRLASRCRRSGKRLLHLLHRLARAKSRVLTFFLLTH